MNRFTLLVIAVLAPAVAWADSLGLPSGLGGVYSPYDEGHDGASAFADAYSGYGYGEPPGRTLGSDGQGRNEGRLWVPAPAPPLGRESPDAYQAGSFPTYESRYQAPGLYEQFRPRPGPGDSPWLGRQEAGSLLRDDVGRYRFRGDEQFGADPRIGDLRHGGYRFRPLTEQERGRTAERPGWRPTERTNAPPKPALSRRSIPEREAYGYQPDGWFERYFGEGRR